MQAVLNQEIVEQLLIEVYLLQRELALVEILHEKSLQYPEVWIMFPRWFWIVYCNSWDMLYLRLSRLVDRTKKTLSLTKILEKIGEKGLAQKLKNDPLVTKTEKLRNQIIAHKNQELSLDKDAFNEFHKANKSHFNEFKPLVDKLEGLILKLAQRVEPNVLRENGSVNEIQSEVNELFNFLDKARTSQDRS